MSGVILGSVETIGAQQLSGIGCSDAVAPLLAVGSVDVLIGSGRAVGMVASIVVVSEIGIYPHLSTLDRAEEDVILYIKSMVGPERAAVVTSTGKATSESVARGKEVLAVGVAIALVFGIAPLDSILIVKLIIGIMIKATYTIDVVHTRGLLQGRPFALLTGIVDIIEVVGHGMNLKA